MAKINNISKDKPTQLELNQLLKTNIFSNLNCHNVGRITAFDPATQLCTVELLQIKQFNARTITPVPITNVPLIILGTKNANITFPDPVGTICLLIFMDRNIDSFMETEESYMPATNRMHDFTDCIALCTFKTLVNPIKNYDEKAISLLNTGLIDEIENNTSLKLYPNLIEMLTSGKVKIANTTQSLAKLMQDFLSACASLTVDTNTGFVTSASIENFTNLKTYFNELLSDVGYSDITGGGGGNDNISFLTTSITELQNTVLNIQNSLTTSLTNKIGVPNYQAGVVKTPNVINYADQNGWVHVVVIVNAKNWGGWIGRRGYSDTDSTEGGWDNWIYYFTGNGTNYGTTYMMPIVKGTYYKLTAGSVTFYPAE